MSIKRYGVRLVSSNQGWEKCMDPKGDFILYQTHEDQIKKLKDIIRGLLILPEPGVMAQEARAIYAEARRAVEIPTPIKKFKHGPIFKKTTINV